MIDREMLELAARAAGIPIYQWSGKCVRLDTGGPDKPDVPWNPLIDDGDALRLAVKLGIDVHTGDTFGTNGKGFTTADCFRNGKIISMQVPHLGGPCEATRRAIVRAAAEIGRQM